MSVIANVYVVRHGETEENKLGIIQGQLDTDLNSAGLTQVQRASEGFKATPFEMAYTSDLTRAVKVHHCTPLTANSKSLLTGGNVRRQLKRSSNTIQTFH